MPRKKIVEVVREHLSTDLYFAAYCQVAGAPYLRTERDGSRVTFVFDAAKAGPLVDAWFNRSGTVSAIDYANSIRNLKNLVYKG